jgi:hypothetical protein
MAIEPPGMARSFGAFTPARSAGSHVRVSDSTASAARQSHRFQAHRLILAVFNRETGYIRAAEAIKVEASEGHVRETSTRYSPEQASNGYSP